MEWYIEWYREDPNVKVEVEDRRLRVVFDIRHKCPGCILQILVSKSKDRWEELTTRQGYGGRVELRYEIPEGIDEVYIATDAQYTVRDAIRRYPKNLLCRVYVQKAPTVLSTLLPFIAVGMIVGAYFWLRKR